MASNINPSLTPVNSLANFKFWCQKVLPLVYDDSLSYYEVLGKMVVQLNGVIDNVNADTGNVITLKDAFLELQTYVNNFFDDIDQLASYAERAETAQTAANTSAINAATSASNASASSLAAMNARDTAVAAGEAAQASANNASTAATNANTKANEAAQSAITAQTAQASASHSATLAATDRSAAQTAANTATTKASEANTSALNAETSANRAEENKDDTETLVNSVRENLNNIQQNTQDISDLKNYNNSYFPNALDFLTKKAFTRQYEFSRHSRSIKIDGNKMIVTHESGAITDHTRYLINAFGDEVRVVSGTTLTPLESECLPIGLIKNNIAILHYCDSIDYATINRDGFAIGLLDDENNVLFFGPFTGTRETESCIVPNLPNLLDQYPTATKFAFYYYSRSASTHTSIYSFVPWQNISA